MVGFLASIVFLAFVCAFQWGLLFLIVSVAHGVKVMLGGKPAAAAERRGTCPACGWAVRLQQQRKGEPGWMVCSGHCRGDSVCSGTGLICLEDGGKPEGKGS